MKISGFSSVKSGSGVKKKGSVSSTGSFADLLTAAAEEASASSPVSDVSATSALSNLLALQEISEDEVRRKKLVQQGRNMLDSLEKLRGQLLDGRVSLQTLRDIQRQIAIEKQYVVDPALQSIIADIELRASVEVAKLETALLNQRAGRSDRLDDGPI